MDSRARLIFGNSLIGAVRSDEPWKAFGYKRRPTRMSLFNLFMPAWRRMLVERMAREFVAAYAAAFLRAYEDHENLAADVFQCCAGGGRAFEAACGPITEFAANVGLYRSASPEKVADVLLHRLHVDSVPDRRWTARLLWGAAQFPQQLANITMFTKAYGCDMQKWPTGQSDAKWLAETENMLSGLRANAAYKRALANP